VLSSIIVVLCSSRYLSVTVQHLAWNARPGLAPIQSLPPLVYSVYSRQRQQFSADARLVRDAHREKSRGSIDFDIGGKSTARVCRYCTVVLVLVLVSDFRISGVSVFQTKHGAGGELGMLAECQWES